MNMNSHCMLSTEDHVVHLGLMTAALFAQRVARTWHSSVLRGDFLVGDGPVPTGQILAPLCHKEKENLDQNLIGKKKKMKAKSSVGE